MTEKTQAPDKITLNDAVNRAAALMEHTLGNGELAELRRANPQEPYSPALWKVLAQLPEPWSRQELERRWGIVLQGLAHCLPLHRPGMRLGRTLANVGYSELRLTRLLRADEEQLMAELVRLAKYLHSKGEPLDWADAARLLLEVDAPWASKHRRAIARSYYGAQYHSDEKS